MSKSIWHKYDEIPKAWNLIVDDCGNWAYLSDIYNLEKELDRTRKALDVAVDALKKIGSGDIIEHSVVGHENDNKIFIANTALEQITALNKGNNNE